MADKAGTVKTAVNVYVSPSGSTKKAGREISSQLEAKGYSVQEFDLAKYRGKEKEVYEAIGSSSILIVGSPVYTGNALSPVLSFLNNMPRADGKPALAYVTFGAISKGDSLFQMAGVLDKKGFDVLGLAAVVAEHSMMYNSNKPFGKGRPGEMDKSEIKSWIDSVASALGSDSTKTMDYAGTKQQKLFGKVMQATAFRPEVAGLIFPPVSFKEELCDSCGACMEACPSGRLENLPDINKSIKCLHCYQCVKVCKKGAMSSPVWIMQPVLHFLALASRGTSEPDTIYYQ